MRLLSAPWVLPIARPPIAEGAVLLAADGTVQAVGRRADLKRELGAGAEERGAGALLPGLVNAHTHLELSVLAGRVPGGEGLVAWATSVPREAAVMPLPQWKSAAARAAQAMSATGTAAVGDVGNTLAAVEALEAAALSGVFFHELLGSREARTGDALADAESERRALQASRPWPARLGYVPAPHAPYSADPALLRRIFAAAAKTPHPTSIHAAEDEDEIALLRDGTGRWLPIFEALGVSAGARTPGLRPLPYLESLGAFSAPRPPLLVHMVHADAEDRAVARRYGAPVVLCPRSNIHIGGKLPDVAAFLAEGLTLALGTDSLASAPNLSLWGEIATLGERLADVAPEVWLRAATAGGAAALGLGGFGAFSPGKKPGVLDVALDDPAEPLPSLVRNPTPDVRWMVTA